MSPHSLTATLSTGRLEGRKLSRFSRGRVLIFLPAAGELLGLGPFLGVSLGYRLFGEIPIAQLPWPQNLAKEEDNVLGGVRTGHWSRGPGITPHRAFLTVLLLVAFLAEAGNGKMAPLSSPPRLLCRGNFTCP